MRRILIVDDESAIRTLLTLAFAGAGYDVRTAPDGPQAIELCTSEPFDVLLSDVVMPAMNGHDLVRWIAEHRPSVRTVLMTGFDQACLSCPQGPGCRVLRKPFRPHEAIALVDEALGEQGLCL